MLPIQQWYGMVGMFHVSPLNCGWLCSRNWVLETFWAGEWGWKRVASYVTVEKNPTSSVPCLVLFGMLSGAGLLLNIWLLAYLQLCNGVFRMCRVKVLEVFSWRMCWLQTVYCLWMKRNHRIFQQCASDKDQIILTIVNYISTFLSSKRYVKQTQLNKDLCASWGLSVSTCSWVLVV